MKIAIIGTRGIPASYSGFETSVQETAIRFVQKDIETIVYCRANHYSKRLKDYKGVKLVYLPSIKSKHLDTLSNTLLSFLYLIFKKYNIVIVYGVGNALFIPLIKLTGTPVVSIVDGADWERKKWGKFAKGFLKFSRFFAVNFSNYYVVDNELLVEEYYKRFGEKPVYIPYGANLYFTNNMVFLKKYGLEDNKYIIFVGRFVKEKGIEFLIENFEKVKTNIKLVITGDNVTDKEYVEKIKSTKDHRIIFTGFLYGEEYETLLHNALFYISCSFLEGTSPSLLSAMAINGFALVSDLKENLEVLKGSCATFKTGDGAEFKNKLECYLNNSSVIETEREMTKNIVHQFYNWEKITEQYISLFNAILKNNELVR
jgi:glycosyltransferase involved in cell wall biosynthesis